MYTRVVHFPIRAHNPSRPHNSYPDMATSVHAVPAPFIVTLRRIMDLDPALPEISWSPDGTRVVINDVRNLHVKSTSQFKCVRR